MGVALEQDWWAGVGEGDSLLRGALWELVLRTVKAAII